VLFDFDGVLVDSEPIYDQLTRELLAELAVDAPPALFDRLRGLRSQEEWELIVSELAIDANPAELAHRAEAHRTQRMVDGGPVPEVPGAHRLIDDLTARRIPIAVVSSSPTDRVRVMLDRQGFGRDVAVVVGGDAVGRGKPDPECYLAAAAGLGVPTRSCIVIEDSSRGVEAGHAAGAVCVHLTRGRPHPLAVYAVPDLNDLSADSLSEVVSSRA
jgi:HAD superfamily hydrolase (TIGR01509 family)